MKFRYLDKNKMKNKMNNLPKATGVYAFKNGREFLYIGKAANIKNRVKNHFQQPTYKDEMFLGKVKKIGYIKTESEIEALILESKLIKKRQPKYNTLWKDSKNYFYVAIADNGYVFLTHQFEIRNSKFKIDFIGPFVDGKAIKQTLKILRRALPYYTQKKHPRNQCSWCYLGLCPGFTPNKTKLKRDLNRLKAVLRGKKSFVLSGLKKEMNSASKNQDFERAAELRNKIFALEKILINSKIIKQTGRPIRYKRIEGYDISNIQGKFAAGSMVVFINEEPAKELYRKFKIRMKQEPNDTAMLKEVLKRRIKHKEWPLPNLMLIDGGKGQLNAAKAAFRIMNYELGIKNIEIMALAKKNNELFAKGRKNPLLLKNLPQEFSNLLLRVRDEAHRFAITYHKKLREKKLLQ